MEDLLELLERNPSQEWIVWGEENDKVFFIRAFPSQAAAIDYRNRIERMNIAAAVSKASSPLPLQSLQPPPAKEPHSIESLGEVAFAWLEVAQLLENYRRVDAWMDHLEKHPDFLKVEEWISHLPKDKQSEVQRCVKAFLKKPAEIPVCAGESCSLSTDEKDQREEKKEPEKEEKPKESKAPKDEKPEESKAPKDEKPEEPKAPKDEKPKDVEPEEPVRSPTHRSRIATRRSRPPPRSSRSSDDSDSSEQKSPERGPRRTREEPPDERESSVQTVRSSARQVSVSRPVRSRRK